jgi:hypothetical protein
VAEDRLIQSGRVLVDLQIQEMEEENIEEEEEEELLSFETSNYSKLDYSLHGVSSQAIRLLNI